MTNTTNWRQEDIDEVVHLIDEWFQAIEDGIANERLPNLFGRRFSARECDVFIETLDAIFHNELIKYSDYHAKIGINTRGKPMDVTPDFNRLDGASREAFLQEVIAKRDEVQRRVDERMKKSHEEYERRRKVRETNQDSNNSAYTDPAYDWYFGFFGG